MLIENGLSPSELHDFMRSSEKPLIIAGEKPRQQPHTHDKASLWVARFNERGQAVFAKWIQENIQEESGLLADQIAPRFRAIENEGVKFDAEEMTELCRRGLAEIYGPSPPQSLIDFLVTNPDDEEDVEPALPEDAATATESSALPTVDSLEKFVQWTRGESPVVDIPDEDLRLAARLVVAARERDPQVISELPGDAGKYAELQKLLLQPTRIPETRAGLNASAPQLRQYDADREYASMEVVATLPRRGSGQAFFLMIEAMIDGDETFTLSFHDMAKAFPDNGEIILFPDLGIDPVVGRPAAYRVQRTSTSGNAKFRVVSPGRALVRVLYVPIASNNPDGIRESLVELTRTTQEPTAMFVLSDGLCIKPRGGALSRMNQPDYDWTFDAWSGISAVEFHKAPYILTHLTRPQLQYECAPLAVSARRFLRKLSEKKAVTLTNRQIASIIEHVNADPVGIDAAQRERVVGKLETLSRIEPEYESLIADLMSTEIVKKDIEGRIQQQIDSTSDEIRKERKALENLRKEQQRLQESISDLKVEFDERVKKLRSAMRRAFEGAKAKEAETLAQVGLLQVLKVDELSSRERLYDEARSAVPMSGINVRSVDPIEVPLADVFRTVGFPDAVCTLYADTIEIGFSAGLPLIVEGPGAAVVSHKISCCLSRGGGAELDIPLGLSSAEPFKTIVAAHTEGTLVLRNANLSDMSVYSGLLIDEFVAYQLRSGPCVSPRRLILSGAGGPAALPWPVDVEQVALKLNLGMTPCTPHEMAGLEDFKPASPLQARVWARLKASIEGHAQETNIELLLAVMLQGRLNAGSSA